MFTFRSPPPLPVKVYQMFTFCSPPPLPVKVYQMFTFRFPPPLPVKVYQCSMMADSCGGCLTADTKYNCGWCSDRRCTIEAQCHTTGWLDSTAICPNPAIYSVSGAAAAAAAAAAGEGWRLFTARTQSPREKSAKRRPF